MKGDTTPILLLEVNRIDLTKQQHRLKLIEKPDKEINISGIFSMMGSNSVFLSPASLVSAFSGQTVEYDFYLFHYNLESPC